jgi:flagellar biosynthetic protein FliO
MLGPFLSLALVFALLGALWVVLRRLNEQAGAGRHLRVLESAPLGRGSQLTLVRVGERCFLLAATPEHVSVVSEFDADRLPCTTQVPLPRLRLFSCWPWPKGKPDLA